MSAFGPPRGTTEVTGTTFDDAVLRSPVPVLVEFGADWCGPCRMIAPVLTAIAEEQGDRLTVSVLDYDGSPEIGARYGVLGLPTLILFRDGEAVMQVTGARPKARLQSEIEAALALPVA